MSLSLGPISRNGTPNNALPKLVVAQKDKKKSSYNKLLIYEKQWTD